MELLIVILILSIFSTLSVRLYRHQVIKAHRCVATKALFQLAGQLEHYYYTHNTYEGATLVKLNLPSSTETGFYEMKLVKLEKANFFIQATPVGVQADDLECGIFGLDQAGRQSITGVGLVRDCWF